MERLTHRETPENTWFVSLGKCRDTWYTMHDIGYCGEAVNRLAAYEDTGLMPEQITALQAEVERVREERDKAIGDLEIVTDCETCKFEDLSDNDEPCCDCYTSKSNWQWRGLQEVSGDD